MTRFLLAAAIIFLLMAGWIIVQQIVRNFAARHPELGATKEEGEGCGHCACDTNSCQKHNKT